MSELSKKYYLSLIKALALSNDYAKSFYTFDENSTIAHFYSHIAPIIENDLMRQPQLSREEKDNIIKVYLQKMVEVEKERRTTGRSTTIIKLEEIIQKTLQLNDLTIDSLPYFAELPTGQLNARILKVPSCNEYLILFENQLFVFVLLLSKILALSLPIIQEKNGQIAISLDEKAIGNHLYHNPEPIQRFYELISAYVITGMVNNAPRYNISPEAYRLTEYFIDSMEIFILSHEYGHLLNGHLGDNNIVKNNLIVKSTLGIEPVNEVHLKWAQEWEADLTATKIAIASSEVTGINPAWIHASIYLFFHGLNYFDRANSLFSKDLYDTEDKRVIVNSTTHPPPAMRLSNVSINKEIAKDTSGVSDIVTKVLNTLWDEIEPKLLDLKKKIRDNKI